MKRYFVSLALAVWLVIAGAPATVAQAGDALPPALDSLFGGPFSLIDS